MSVRENDVSLQARWKLDQTGATWCRIEPVRKPDRLRQQSSFMCAISSICPEARSAMVRHAAGDDPGRRGSTLFCGQVVRVTIWACRSRRLPATNGRCGRRRRGRRSWVAKSSRNGKCRHAPSALKINPGCAELHDRRFLDAGRRAPRSTWDGDVWLVSLVGLPSGELQTDRVGLFQPLGLKGSQGNSSNATTR